MGLFSRNKTPDTVSPEENQDSPVSENTATDQEEERFIFTSQSQSAGRERSEEVSSRHDTFETYISPQDIAAGPDEEEPEEDVRLDRRMALLETGDIVWSWILMSVPIIGFIFALIWALGLCRNRQRRYLARAFLTIAVITCVLILISYFFYTLVFRFRLDDLPAVIRTIYNWAWNGFVTMIGKKK